MERFFIVGCSRSGTTVIQKKVSEYLGLTTLPETNFFGIACGGGVWGRFAARLGLPRARCHRALHELKEILDPYQVDLQVPESPLNLHHASRYFYLALDQLAVIDQCPGWVEKTPKHYRHIPLIERHVPDAKFVHVVRFGPDVVASIVDRARRFPEPFKGQDDPAYAIHAWNQSIRTARQYLGVPGHGFVLYESFCTDPLVALKGLAYSFYGDAAVPVFHAKGNDRLFGKEESWKMGVGHEIRLSKSKFPLVFSLEEQKSIKARLDFECYDSLLSELY